MSELKRIVKGLRPGVTVELELANKAPERPLAEALDGLLGPSLLEQALEEGAKTPKRRGVNPLRPYVLKGKVDVVALAPEAPRFDASLLRSALAKKTLGKRLKEKEKQALWAWERAKVMARLRPKEGKGND